MNAVREPNGCGCVVERIAPASTPPTTPIQEQYCSLQRAYSRSTDELCLNKDRAMQERSLTRAPVSTLSDIPDLRAPLLVCFSHLRWDFVWQRPQHLLSRAAKHYRILIIEEPMLKPDIQPHMDVSTRPGGITIVVPMLPEGLSESDVILAQRRLVDRLLAREPEGPRVFWYYTPMALAFSSHLDCDLCVYDNMDELSLFRGASQEMIDLENELFARADVVFTGGMSLYEAKRGRHPNVHGFPS